VHLSVIIVISDIVVSISQVMAVFPHVHPYFPVVTLPSLIPVSCCLMTLN
jgi:hypothetical protein